MTMQQHIEPQRRGMFFHVFVVNKDTDRRAYLGAYNSEETAKQYAVEAVGIEGTYDIFPSVHANPVIVKQEYKHKKFSEEGNLWKQLRPMRNIHKGRP